jgi:hypothetical protein
MLSSVQSQSAGSYDQANLRKRFVTSSLINKLIIDCCLPFQLSLLVLHFLTLKKNYSHILQNYNLVIYKSTLFHICTMQTEVKRIFVFGYEVSPSSCRSGLAVVLILILEGQIPVLILVLGDSFLVNITALSAHIPTPVLIEPILEAVNTSGINHFPWQIVRLVLHSNAKGIYTSCHVDSWLTHFHAVPSRTTADKIK